MYEDYMDEVPLDVNKRGNWNVYWLVGKGRFKLDITRGDLYVSRVV